MTYFCCDAPLDAHHNFTVFAQQKNITLSHGKVTYIFLLFCLKHHAALYHAEVVLTMLIATTTNMSFFLY